MCILCVVQKWSRKIATMLPWLVIPLIGLWALSQLLPPGFRFEVTSPRLACVLVLLVTLFWYEILMPQLSAWRARRNALLREKKRSQAIEMQKLRKMATRRCRNCLSPYRDQNPGGGRFMCSYCGHISKRPVLDMPGCSGLSITHDPRYAGLSISNSGIIGDLVSKSGKIWNGKVWLENGWISGQESLENGNWATVSSAGKSGYQGKNRDRCISSGGHCLGGETYPGLVYFGCKLFSSFLLSIRWISRTIFRVSFSREDALSEAENKAMLSEKGENGMSFHESKGEKARRKAEEKRQARLERELLAEEERKQREEVARLVEERRRLRDESMEVEKERNKGSTPERQKDSKREAEKKRQDRRKEKDKGSNKSNSDVEDLERRASKESEKKRVFEKRSEIERRDIHKSAIESAKAQNSESFGKVSSINNMSRGSGAKYLDRVKGSLLSSSKALNGASFFGKGTHASANVVWKMNKPNGSVDHAQTASNLREENLSGQVPAKLNSNGADKITETNFQRLVVSEQQPQAAPKKSWQHLFTRTSATPLASNANTTGTLNSNPQAGAQSPQFLGQPSSTQPLDNQIYFTTSLPYALSPVPNFSTGGGSVFSSAAEPIFCPSAKLPAELKLEESELFEDPCYVPDPVSLLGPVSESLDNFPLDLGSGFVTDVGLEKFHSPKFVSASDEVSRPSPIESPMSRLRIVEEKRVNSSQIPGSPKIDGLKSSSLSNSSNEQEQGTWQMWGTPPLGQDGLGLLGGPASWILPLRQNQLNQDDGTHPPSYKATASQFVMENQVAPGTGSPQKARLGNCNNVGTFNHLSPCSNDNGPWLQKTVFHPSGDAENCITPFNLEGATSGNEVIYGSPIGSAATRPFESCPTSFWSKKDKAVHSLGEGVGNLTLARPSIGGLFSSPDVQSLWSFN